jgi:dinuclear metal center YbgI/SA1388 family protein
MKNNGLPLRKVVAAIETLAPPELAEDWDNVGLIVKPRRGRPVRKVLLTIDLTEAVMTEALAARADLVVAYHPPIFQALRTLTGQRPNERAVMRAVESGIAVYSPHTALDAVEGGVNDWLASGLGPARVRPLAPSPGAEDDKRTGQGRLVVLEKPVAPATLIRRLKEHLGLKYVRVARPRPGTRTVRRIALCAGAGASVLMGTPADVYLTGEMGHHDVLAAVGNGVWVVLSEHTHTERGYLKLFKRSLARALGAGVTVQLSRQDRDPLQLG